MSTQSNINQEDSIPHKNPLNSPNSRISTPTSPNSYPDTSPISGDFATSEIDEIEPIHFDGSELLEVDENAIDDHDSDVPNVSRLRIKKKITRSDADSFVGGKSVNDLGAEYQSDKLEDEVSTLKEDPYTKPVSTIQKNSSNQKVFSFSLPFGGLSGIRSNISHKFQNFRDNNKKDEDVNLSHMPYRSRNPSMTTIDEANYFKNVKNADNARLRAAKQALAASVNEMVPSIIKKAKPWDQAFSELEGNVVLLGGYRGSILRDAKTHKRVWIPIKAGLKLKKVDLLLGPDEEDEEKAHTKILPDGILANVGPLDICKKLIKRLQMNPKVSFHSYGYDWRLSGDHCASELEKYLENILEKTGKPSIVIAHSMGGLVTLGVVRRRPELFRGIIFVGCPSECLNILGPIRFGDTVGLSDKILTAETNFMMRSGFMFLPLSGQVFVDRDTHERYDLDLFDPDTWVEFNLNPLVAKERIDHNNHRNMTLPHKTDTSFSLTDSISLNSLSSKLKTLRKRAESFSSRSREQSPSKYGDSSDNEKDFKDDDEDDEYSISFTQAYEYLKRELKKTKEYILSLDYNPDLEMEYPPMAVVYGNTVPSVRGSYVHGKEGIIQGDYYNFFYGRGDGVVHQKWLAPENKGFQFYDPDTQRGQIVGKFASQCGHVNLMTDLKAVGNALASIVEAEEFWKTRGVDKCEN